MSAIRYFASIIICLCLSDGTHGQSYFDILPDVGGIDMQAGATVVFISDSTFYVAGHRYDTSYAGSDAKPWLGQFDYHGDLDTIFSLRDTLYNESFNRHRLLFERKSNENMLGYSGRFIEGFSTPYLYEFNERNGYIVRSALLINKELGISKIAPSQIIYGDDLISLLSYHQDQDSVRLYITELDTLFHVIREFRVEAAATKQFPSYFKRLRSGEYEIISSSRISFTTYYHKYKLHYMKVGQDGKLVKSVWLPSEINISNVLTYAKNVINTSSGEWAIIGHHRIYEPDTCISCISTVPYMGLVNGTFDSMYWMTRFFALPYNVGLTYHVFTLTEVQDGFIGVGQCLTNLEGYNKSGVIFKASLDGDSMWMKHIIPLGWDHDRFLHGQLTDVTTTPSGSIIAVGEVADNDLQIYRPWILHLDTDGCLVPGCNLVSGSIVPDPVSPERSDFRIFPNPVRDDLYLLCTSCRESEYQVQVFSTGGVSLGLTQLSGIKGAQYTLPVDHLPSGSYHLVIRSADTGAMETHRFVRW